MKEKQKVLIIDDDPTLRDLYTQRFKKEGFDVLVATNGDEGIKMAFTHRPVAILLDLMMPVKGGLGALQVLKTMPNVRDIPVAVFTAYPSDEYRDQSKRDGAALFFSKSETMPKDLVEQVKALIQE